MSHVVDFIKKHETAVTVVTTVAVGAAIGAIVAAISKDRNDPDYETSE
jgi:hypothetical protein